MDNEHLMIILKRLNERDNMQPLSPQRVWDVLLETEIEKFGQSLNKSDTHVALLAGLHLRNDSLYTSHNYAQLIEHDATGAYWHGIMHRMEQDYSNAKYWFMRVGHHPAMDVTRDRAADWLRTEANLDNLSQGRIRDTLLKYRDHDGWTPSSFVDMITWQEGSGSSDSAQRAILEQLQRIEIDALFEFTLVM